ncbi:MFS transporter [Nitrospira sp. Nam80]
MEAAATPAHETIRTDIPQRLDRLPWSRWHWLVVTALGVTWLLDGLEVTIVGALGAVLTHPNTLHLTETEVGLTASAYLAGSVSGALLFSYLTDRQGRKKWFTRTLMLYLAATVLTAFSWNLWTFMLCRFFAGAGIGGEYSAINSAIDELIPARARGHTDLAINGSWWLGTVVGALLTIPLLDPSLIAEQLGWRLCFGFGAVLGLGMIIVRRYLPESPRWLMTHGRVDEAERIVRGIEKEIMEETSADRLPDPQGTIVIRPNPHVTVLTVAQELFRSYPSRTVLGVSLMVTQSFLYNAVFFTYALVLSKFHHVPPQSVGWYLLPFAVFNFLGPLLLGRLFDTVGRRVMLTVTYGTAGLLLGFTGYLFAQDYLTAATQTMAWSVTFFFASAGASAAYLTVSEIFPLEIRAMAIAFFFIVGQGAGVLSPWFFGHLIESSASSVFVGYLVGAALMVLGALIAFVYGVDAERRSLEEIAKPLSAEN